MIKKWSESKASSDELHVPRPNPFVPTDFDIVPLANWDCERRSKLLHASDAPPLLLHNSDRVQCWHLHDSAFKKPKGEKETRNKRLFLFFCGLISCVSLFLISQCFDSSGNSAVECCSSVLNADNSLG